MQYLHISQVGGLFHELYFPEDIDLSNVKILKISNNYLDANNLFWSHILDIKTIKKIIDEYPLSSCPQYIAIKGNPELFLKQVEEAKKKLCTKDNDEKTFFKYLETLSIACRLYSDYISYSYNITVQNGFEINESSAKRIYDDCLKEELNPYLNFIITNIMPCIREYNPEIVFIDGRPSMYNMTICRLIKKENLNIHICITRHSSEYYSLNKLENYLQKNDFLFLMVDSVILDFFAETEQKLISALYEKQNLNSVPNLIFKDTKSISFTKIQIPNTDYKPEISESSLSRKMLNVHIEKHAKCYWNKCYFCGINKKYHFENDTTKDKYFNNNLESLLPSLKGIEYVWFIDEAITVSKLKKIATFFIEKKIHIYWQARCRITPELLNEETIKLLASSGLKELRLGLESASITVLNSMNKFEKDFSLKIVEDICQKYQNNGISIHFPMIIGFPGETDADRRMTYDFLQSMNRKYKITFNINVFMLDISSYVFLNADKFDIDILDNDLTLNDSLTNSVKWIRKNENIDMQLNLLRDQYMRDILYTWMPLHAIIKPHIFYRLSETIRNTLIWKSINSGNKKEKIIDENNSEFILSDNISIGYDSKRKINVIYNWDTHHYVIGNENFLLLLKSFNKPQTIAKSINSLVSIDKEIFNPIEVEKLIYKLISNKFIIKE